jgi:diguanylate cyclase (GGDEF)-like protein
VLERLPLRGLLAGLIAAAAVVAILAGLAGGDGTEERLLAATTRMQSALLAEGTADRRPFQVAVADALAQTRPGSRERAMVVDQAEVADRWFATATSDTASREMLLNRFGARNAALGATLLREGAAAHEARHRLVLLGALPLAALALAGLALAVWRRWREQAARAAEDRRILADDRRHRAQQEEFSRALQGTRSEREAQRMLKRQLERTLGDSSATVLNRNNSDNRLEAVTGLAADSVLAMSIPDAEPDDCLAVRFGQPQERAGGAVPLLGCELCGALEGSVTCVPSLVGGEVIGSVLLETPQPLDVVGHRRLADAVTQSAPVLASMRNLRLAETRAATDVLTGLANRRSAEKTLKLMIANADRSVSSCAVAMFDLDHFKNVNDVYGHEKGDELLAAVGNTATTTLRASDFVARVGGEEFLVILPDTDVEGAVLVCDKLRESIAGIRLKGVGQSPSASFGIAMFPYDAVEPEALLRDADRALYAAKSSGRNCVKTHGAANTAEPMAPDPDVTGA